MWWIIKLCVYFFVIGFLLDFTTVPEFLYWESRGYTVDENRIIGVLIHLPFLFKPLFSFKINSLDRDQVNVLLFRTSFLNCILNFVSSASNDFAVILCTLILCETFMMIILICLEYHMVKDIKAVSVSNIAKLFGKFIGQFISLFQSNKVDLPHLFLVSSCIQAVFTLCLFLFRIYSPVKDEQIIIIMDDTNISDENVQEAPFQEKTSCYAKMCACFVKDKNPVSNLSWFLFITTAIPVYLEALTYDLSEVKQFPDSFFSVFTTGDGLGAISVVSIFVYVVHVNKNRVRPICCLYTAVKIVLHLSVIYGIAEAELNNTEIFLLWGFIHFANSFADEGLYNLFLLDTTRRSEGSVFYLAKCQFIQTLGMIISFVLTTLNMCILGLDRKDYTNMVPYIGIVISLHALSFLTVIYL